MLNQAVQDFMLRVDSAKTETAVVRVVERHLEKLGITHYALGEVGNFAGDPPIQLTNYPKEWVDRYVNNLFFYYDPVAKMARERYRGFAWTEIPLPPDADKRAREVFFGGRDYGLNNGISVPVRGGHNYLAVASFVNDKIDVNQDLIGALELTTLWFHTRVSQLRQRRQSKVELTARQRETLHWAAQGKSDWEIGEILTISQETVHRHIENAKRKYGVPTRLQAILRAVKDEQIRI
jgi:DNA-binding CsgD family transcriptional regulator